VVGLFGLGPTTAATDEEMVRFYQDLSQAGEQLENFCLEHKLALANTIVQTS